MCLFLYLEQRTLRCLYPRKPTDRGVGKKYCEEAMNLIALEPWVNVRFVGYVIKLVD